MLRCLRNKTGLFKKLHFFRSDSIDADRIFNDNTILFSLFLLGFIVRFAGYDSEGYWSDEIITRMVITKPFVSIIREGLVEGHMPLYFLFTMLIERIFGDGRLALILPNILAGSFAIPLTWHISKLLPNPNRLKSIAATAIVATSPMLVSYSQELRPYSFMVLGGLATLFLYLKSFNNFRAAIFFGPIALLFGLTHPTSSFLLIALFICHLTMLFRGGWRALSLFPGFAFAGLPLLAIALSTADSLRLQIILDSGFSSPIYGLVLHLIFIGSNYTMGSSLSHFAANDLWSYLFPVSIVCMPIFAFLILSGLFINSLREIGVLEKVSVILLFISIIASTATPIFINPRYMLFAYPLAYLLLASGLSKISSQRAARALLAALIIGNLSVIHIRLNRVDLDQWKEAVEYINNHSAPDELLYTPHVGVLDIIYFYTNKSDLIIPEIGRFKYMLDSLKDLNYYDPNDLTSQIAASHPGVWYLDKPSINNAEVKPKRKTNLVSIFSNIVAEKRDPLDKDDFSTLFPDSTTTTFKGVRLIHFQQ
jgi:hypothetical protein